MLKIALTRMDSGRHDPARFERDREDFLAPLRQEFTLIATNPGEAVEADLHVVFIASGGSEEGSAASIPNCRARSSCWPTASTIPCRPPWKFPAGCAGRAKRLRSSTATMSPWLPACAAWPFFSARSGPWPGLSASSASRRTG